MNQDSVHKIELLLIQAILTLMTIVYLIAILFSLQYLFYIPRLGLLSLMGIFGLVGLWLLFVIHEFKETWLKVITGLCLASGIISAGILIFIFFPKHPENNEFIIYIGGILSLIIIAVWSGIKLLRK